MQITRKPLPLNIDPGANLLAICDQINRVLQQPEYAAAKQKLEFAYDLCAAGAKLLDKQHAGKGTVGSELPFTAADVGQAPSHGVLGVVHVGNLANMENCQNPNVLQVITALMEFNPSAFRNYDKR